MALSDRLTPPSRLGAQCRVCLLLKVLPPDDQVTLQRWLADPTVTFVQITAALRAEGHAANSDGVSRHARGFCLAASPTR